MMVAFMLLGFVLEAYAIWQGPFHGKWAEAAFWMACSVSAELSWRAHKK